MRASVRFLHHYRVAISHQSCLDLEVVLVCDQVSAVHANSGLGVGDLEAGELGDDLGGHLGVEDPAVGKPILAKVGVGFDTESNLVGTLLGGNSRSATGHVVEDGGSALA